MQVRFNQLIAELFSQLGLESPRAPAQNHHLELQQAGTLHLSYQPRTESMVIYRMLKRSGDECVPAHYLSLLRTNLFADDPVQRGVGVDNDDTLVWWIQTPLKNLDIKGLHALLDEFFSDGKQGETTLNPSAPKHAGDSARKRFEQFNPGSGK
jgi:hypothetical protein